MLQEPVHVGPGDTQQLGQLPLLVVSDPARGYLILRLDVGRLIILIGEVQQRLIPWNTLGRRPGRYPGADRRLAPRTRGIASNAWQCPGR